MMNNIQDSRMAGINGGEITCEQGGWMFGLGTALVTNPITAGAGLFILMAGTAALVTGDCDF